MRKLEVTDTPLLRSIIKNEISGQSELRFLHRLHCILLVGYGFSCYQVAEWFGEHPRTVERWAHNFQENGVDGLKDKNRMGRPCKVSDEDLNQLITENNPKSGRTWL